MVHRLVPSFIYSCWKLRQILEDQVPRFADADFDSFNSDEDCIFFYYFVLNIVIFESCCLPQVVPHGASSCNL